MESLYFRNVTYTILKYFTIFLKLDKPFTFFYQ